MKWLALLAALFASPAFAVDVTAYGAIPNDGLDDLAAFVAADAATAGEVFVPAGVYDLSAALTLAAGHKLRCEDSASTVLQITSATSDLLVLPNGYDTVENCGFAASVPRTAGIFIKVSSPWVSLLHLRMQAPYYGIDLSAGTVALFADGIQIISPVPTYGIGVNISACILCKLRLVNVLAGASPHGVGIAISNSGDVTLDDPNLLGANINLLLNPNSGQVIASVHSVGGWYDQAAIYNVLVSTLGTGAIRRAAFSGGWASGGGVVPTVNFNVAGNVDGLSIDDMDLYGAVYGIAAVSSSVKNLEIRGNRIAGNSSFGVYLDGTVNVSITNNRIGQSGGFGVNGTGVKLVNSPVKTLMDGNDLCGNTTVLSGATGAQSKLTADNLCYP